MAGKTNDRRLVRKQRVRRRVKGTDQQPRLSVYKSLRYTYAQLISDETGQVIAAASTRQLGAAKSTSSVESAKVLGQRLAELAQQKNIEHAVFDRNGYIYHGRVAAVAEGAREGGLKF